MRRPLLSAILTGSILVAMTTVPSSAGASLVAPGDCGWTVMPSPQNARTSQMGFLGVGASSPTDAWAVGYDRTASVRPGVIEHWDGVRWSLVRNPDPDYSFLYDVVAFAPDDAWIVGMTAPTVQDHRPLTMHWDGVAWTVVPNAGTGRGLNSVDGVAPDDIWAVGAGGGQHWNGSTWELDPDANFGTVDAVSSTDVWALGYRYIQGRDRDVFGHWNGSSWSTTKPFKLDGAQGLAAVGADDVWAVGASKSRPGLRTFSEHWDGTGWSLVDAPTAGRWAAYHALAAKSSDDLWAVGALNQIGIGMHWDGSAWTAERLPHSPQREVLYGVTSVPGGGWWAVGWQGEYPVVMQHC